MRPLQNRKGNNGNNSKNVGFISGKGGNRKRMVGGGSKQEQNKVDDIFIIESDEECEKGPERDLPSHNKNLSTTSVLTNSKTNAGGNVGGIGSPICKITSVASTSGLSPNVGTEAKTGQRALPVVSSTNGRLPMRHEDHVLFLLSTLPHLRRDKQRLLKEKAERETRMAGMKRELQEKEDLIADLQNKIQEMEKEKIVVNRNLDLDSVAVLINVRDGMKDILSVVNDATKSVNADTHKENEILKRLQDQKKREMQHQLKNAVKSLEQDFNKRFLELQTRSKRMKADLSNNIMRIQAGRMTSMMQNTAALGDGDNTLANANEMKIPKSGIRKRMYSSSSGVSTSPCVARVIKFATRRKGSNQDVLKNASMRVVKKEPEENVTVLS